MYLSAYQVGSGELSFQSPYIAGSSAKELFLSPDKKYIMIVTADGDGQERLYVCDPVYSRVCCSGCEYLR